MKSLKSILTPIAFASALFIAFAFQSVIAWYDVNGYLPGGTLAITRPRDCSIQQDVVICRVGMVEPNSPFANQPLFATSIDAETNNGSVIPIHTTNLLYRFYN